MSDNTLQFPKADYLDVEDTDTLTDRELCIAVFQHRARLANDLETGRRPRTEENLKLLAEFDEDVEYCRQFL